MVEDQVRAKDKLKFFYSILNISALNFSSNLAVRIFSSLILIPLVILAVTLSKSLFYVMMVLLTILMTFEWLDLIKSSKSIKRWRLVGLIYILIPIWSVFQLRDMGGNILLWMLIIIWSTDIFAYFSGKNFGGPKLFPSISPNKTWSGLFGGIFAAMLVGFLSSFMFAGSVLFFVVMSAALAVVGQIGDLVESKFKRMFEVKDSGNIIPGHGGVLDRIDALVTVAPIVLILSCIYSDNFIVL